MSHLRTLLRFTRMVRNYASLRMEGWIEELPYYEILGKMGIKPNNILTTELKIDEEMVDEYWDNFIEETFNDFYDDSRDSFYSECGDGLAEFSPNEAFHLLCECNKWSKDEYDIQLELKSPFRIWNTLAYWIVKTEDTISDDFYSEFDKKIRVEYLKIQQIEMRQQKDENTKKTTICDICYENKQIFACCSSCKGKMLCGECYIEVANECPFCRGIMLVPIRLRRWEKVELGGCSCYGKSEYKEAWLGKMVNVCDAIRMRE
jgi:hypothetical protein